MMPNQHDFAKLLGLAETYGKASVAASAEYRTAMDRIGRDTVDVTTLASKEPEVRRLNKINNDCYAVMTAEMENVNDRFPGLSLCNPAPFVGWTGELASYHAHIKTSIRDLALKHWEQSARDEIAAVRKLLVRERDAGQFKPGEYAFRPDGVLRIKRVFKRAARAIDLHTGDEIGIHGSYKPVSQRTAKRLLKLCERRKDFLAECGIL